MLPEDEKFLAILPALGTYRSLICLHGTLPERDFFSYFDLPIIATDGAANLLYHHNITADIIIGDWDSVGVPIDERVKKIIIKDQSFSDFQKALKFSQDNHLSPSIVLGINGGYIDHILNNISIVAQTDSITYTSPNLGISVRNCLTLKLPRETKLSLFGMPAGKVSSKGLRWELENQWLRFPEYNSCFNRTLGEWVEIEVQEGVIFLIIYLTDMVDAGRGDFRNFVNSESKL